MLHRKQVAQRQIDAQRDGTCAQLGDDVILGGGEREEWDQVAQLNKTHYIILYSAINNKHTRRSDTKVSYLEVN